MLEQVKVIWLDCWLLVMVSV
ncbi:hypothetical protein LSH36_1255g00025 [Paralvinella palmiformis]|uniref:Uncharacterized protein n=1 Tax=Paralvinella palmiformis TaxID=53620 RepID=A0AAD9ITP0_9ANNE|nr:hypothetical protein LSH36_1255g00025 [Paralvinella palmiformis]